MTYKIERKRLKNSAGHQSYCLTIMLQNGAKVQFPMASRQEALDYYNGFIRENAVMPSQAIVA